MENRIQFKVWSRFACFTDPSSKLGGEKTSYHIPTYEALKGICKSIYWKPTLVWHVDQVRIIKPIRTESRAMKPLNYHKSENSLAIYTYLSHVEYQVDAHFEWNIHRPELAHDRIDGKHFQIATRMLQRGGRQDIFLGVRDCQGYVEPCEFGEGACAYDEIDELAFGMMFFGFEYPDESGKDHLETLLWAPTMKKGIIAFPKPCGIEIRKNIRKIVPKIFSPGKDFADAASEVEA